MLLVFKLKVMLAVVDEDKNMSTSARIRVRLMLHNSKRLLLVYSVNAEMQSSAKMKAQEQSISHMHRGWMAKKAPEPPMYMLEITTSLGTPALDSRAEVSVMSSSSTS